MDKIESRSLSTPTSSLTLTTFNYGCTTHSLQIPSLARDVLIGYKDVQEYHHQSHAGRGFRNQVVGRYANRVPSGELVTKEGIKLNLEGEGGELAFCDVEQDEAELTSLVLSFPGNAGVCLHGGPRGFDTQLWTSLSRSESQLFPSSSDLSIPSTSSEVLYSHLSPSGTEGFPLTLLVEALISVSPPATNVEQGYESVGRVRVTLRAKIVDDGKSTKEELERGTPVNLTLHWGFNLGDFKGHDGEDIKDHRLWIDASRTTELAPSKLATGTLTPLPPTSPLNFQHGTPTSPSSHRSIGFNFPPSGIDHNIIFDSPINIIKPRVVLSSKDEKVSLQFKTNQSSVQVYTAGHFDRSFSRKPEHSSASSSAEGYDQFGAVFLEFQHPLATFLHEDLKEVAEGSTILKVGEVYENWVEVDVLVKK